jgi:hypothetical protein
MGVDRHGLQHNFKNFGKPSHNIHLFSIFINSTVIHIAHNSSYRLMNYEMNGHKVRSSHVYA